MLTFAPSSEDVRIYEALVLLSLTLHEQELRETLTAIKQLCAEKGGTLLYQEDWGRQGLAYPIRKHREGRFVLFVYELPPSAVPAFDAALLLEKGILRHLLVKTPQHYELVTFSDRMEAWQREKEEHLREEEQRKEEKVRQRIVERAARAVPAVAPPPAPTAVEDVVLEKELGKIISDEDLRL